MHPTTQVDEQTVGGSFSKTQIIRHVLSLDTRPDVTRGDESVTRDLSRDVTKNVTSYVTIDVTSNVVT